KLSKLKRTAGSANSKFKTTGRGGSIKDRITKKAKPLNKKKADNPVVVGKEQMEKLQKENMLLKKENAELQKKNELLEKEKAKLNALVEEMSAHIEQNI
ncbi:hypothetical protein, partial [Desulfamplus magnetovallimortis]